MLHLYDYPLPVDTRQMRTMNRQQYVVTSWVDPSMHTNLTDSYGALCVHIDLGQTAQKRQDERGPLRDDTDDDDDEYELPRHRRRRTDDDKKSDERSAGWFARLWG